MVKRADVLSIYLSIYLSIWFIVLDLLKRDSKGVSILTKTRLFVLPKGLNKFQNPGR